MKMKQQRLKLFGISLFSLVVLGGSVYSFAQLGSHQSAEKNTEKQIETPYNPMEGKQNTSSLDALEEAQSKKDGSIESTIEKAKNTNQEDNSSDFSAFQPDKLDLARADTIQSDLAIFDQLSSQADKNVSDSSKGNKPSNDTPETITIDTPSTVDNQPEIPDTPDLPIIPDEPVDSDTPTTPVEPIVVDYSALESLVTRADGIDKSLYVSGSVSVLMHENYIAKWMISERSATQAQVNQQVQKLQSAIDQLIEKGNIEILQELIIEVAEIDREIYTQESLRTYDQALKKAQTIVAENDSSQHEIDRIYKNLVDAYDGLKMIDEPDLTLVYLERLINECASLSAEDYTPNSYSVLEEKLEAARYVLQQDTVQESEAKAAYQDLLEAKNALVKKADKSVLISLISSAEQLNEEDYTAESWVIFIEALAKAREIASDENATQSTVETAISALESAMNNLIVYEVEEVEEVDESDQSLPEEAETQETESLPEETVPEEPDNIHPSNSDKWDKSTSEIVIADSEEFSNENLSNPLESIFAEPSADWVDSTVLADSDGSII